jgi:hypothetical protein
MPLPPDLLQLLTDAGVAGPENQLLAARYKAAQLAGKTPMPQAQRYGDNHIAPINPMEIAAATIQQYGGNKDSNLLMQEMAANLRKQQAGRSGLADAATQPGANLDNMQIMAGAGGDATGSLGTVIGNVDNRQLKAALEMAKQENQRHLLDRTLAAKEKLAAGDWQLKRDLDKPYQGSGTPLSGTVMRNLRTGTQTTTAPLDNGKAEIKLGETDDKAWERYVKATNAGLATSRSVLGADRNLMNRIDRTMVLIGSKPDYTPEEMSDISISLAGVLTGGNVAARKSIEDISYKSLGMSAAKAAEYLTGHPQEAGVQDFVKRIKDVLINERAAAKARLLQTVVTQATGMQDLVRRKGKTAVDYHRNIGVPDSVMKELGMDVGEPAAATPGAAPKKKYNQTTGEFE